MRELRERQKRNFLVSLALSQGVPMFVAGDEMGRTQYGNNNAYCQDNEVSWIDWGLRDENLALLGFARRLMEFRARHPVFRRRKWFHGRDIYGSGVSDIGWFHTDGHEMTAGEWHEGHRSIAIFLNGREIPTAGPRGEPVVDDSFLLLFNAHGDATTFVLPEPVFGGEWMAVIDTNEPMLDEGERSHKAGDAVATVGHSVLVLRKVS